MMPNRTCLFALVALGLTACGGSTASPSNSSNDAPTIDQASTTRATPSAAGLQVAGTANNAFALNLYAQVAPTANGGNVMTSPLSASLALTMAYAGAEGETATEMASALQLQGSAATIFDSENALSQALAGRAAAALTADQQNAKQAGGAAAAPDPSNYVLQVVNSVWGEKTYPWATPFLDILAQSYGTGVYLEDFVGNPSGALTAINDWVSTETADKINDLLLPGTIDSSTRIVLVNAVHLKLPWQNPFQVAQTASGSFTRGDGTQLTASFMHQDLEAGYVETAEAQVVSLPLSGGQLSVVFALPKNGLASLVSSLTPETWGAMANAGLADVVLSLPKFTFTSASFSLSSALQALGMKTAFNPTAADFKGLCANPPDGDNLFISDVLQKATMDVAENGVEAAAATAVTFAGTAAPVTQATVSFDQPFLVSIVDSSGAILFLGQIDDPTNAGGP